MIYQHIGRTVTSRILTAHILAGASASTTFSWGIVLLSPNADAAPVLTEVTAKTLPADDNNDGNGTRNRNIVSVRSPTSNHGYQHTSNSNAGGMVSIHSALCKHVPVCYISQRITMVTPVKVKGATLRKAGTFIPQKVDTPAGGRSRMKTRMPSPG